MLWVYGLGFFGKKTSEFSVSDDVGSLSVHWLIKFPAYCSLDQVCRTWCCNHDGNTMGKGGSWGLLTPFVSSPRSSCPTGAGSVNVWHSDQPHRRDELKKGIPDYLYNTKKLSAPRQPSSRIILPLFRLCPPSDMLTLHLHEQL